MNDPQDDWTAEQERSHDRKLEQLKADIRIAIKDVLSGVKDDVRLVYCVKMRDLKRNDLGALLTECLDDADTATLAQASFDKEARVFADVIIDEWIDSEAKDTVEFMDEMGLIYAA